MIDLTNLTNEQLRRMVEILRAVVEAAAKPDDRVPLEIRGRASSALVECAELVANEPHEPDARRLIIDAMRKDIDYLRGVEAKLTRQLERACKERDSAETERDRLQRLFDDAGGEEYNVLALIDHYQSDWFRMEKELLDAQKALADRQTVEGWADGGNRYVFTATGTGAWVDLRHANGTIKTFAAADDVFATAADWVRRKVDD